MQMQLQSVSPVITPGGTSSYGPYTYSGSITPVTAAMILAAGDNAFTVPAGSVMALIIPPSTNSVALRLKGTSGSGGTGTITAASSAITAIAVAAGGSGYPPSTTILMQPDTPLGSGAFFYATTGSTGIITALTFISGLGGSTYNSYTGTAQPVKTAESGISISPTNETPYPFDAGNTPPKIWINAASATSGYTQVIFF